MGVGGQRQAPATLLQLKTQYPLYRGWVGLSSVWRVVGNIVLTVASRFADYVIPAQHVHVEYIEIHYLFTSKAKFAVPISTDYFVFFT